MHLLHSALDHSTCHCIYIHLFTQQTYSESSPRPNLKKGSLRIPAIGVHPPTTSETRFRRIALDNEIGGEVWELEDRGGDQGTLEGLECLRGLLSPSEAILSQNLGEGRRHYAVISNEAVVVPYEPKEATDDMD